MRVLILGGDGYLGWPTALHFSNRGHEVALIDNFSKRQWELEEDSLPLNPPPTLGRRINAWYEWSGRKIESFVLDIAQSYRALERVFKEFQPDCIVHYGEQPSAPFSMASREHAIRTQSNNVNGTLNVLFAMRKWTPDAHLIKLGTMGEYGTPNIPISEGWLEVEVGGRRDRVLFPKKPGSFYHLSKVHDSHNIEFACRIWGIRSTDLNQGVVYGIGSYETLQMEELRTSFHYDSVFGTVLNRFVTQAVLGEPLTVYGNGSQTRGYLNLLDTLRCVELAAESPATHGEFRVFNQFTQQFTVLELAHRVVEAAGGVGIDASVRHFENPRVEQEDHFYEAEHSALEELGLKPKLLDAEVLGTMLEYVARHKDAIDRSVLMPTIRWSQ